MFQLPSPLTLRLDVAQVLALRRRLPATLSVREGLVHLTSHADAEDHFLRAGESFDLTGRRDVVISAEQPALLCLERPAPARRAVRALGSWLHRFDKGHGASAVRWCRAPWSLHGRAE